MKRLGTILFNYTFMITMPIWLGTAVLIFMIVEMCDGSNVSNEILLGKRSIF